MAQMFKLIIFLNVETKKEWDKWAGKEKKPTNEMNEKNKQGNEHVDRSKTIREFINLFETKIFLSRFTNIFILIYFPLQIVNKNSNNCFNTWNNMCIENYVFFGVNILQFWLPQIFKLIIFWKCWKQKWMR
jgi:hypothetical protein